MSNLDAQLKTFLQVSRLGSFRRAANEMFITQAAITSRIQALENWLGFEIFTRHSRGVELTQQGEHFLQYARTVIDTLEHGREEARRVKNFQTHYRVMSQFLLVEQFTLDWVDWMKVQAPDVSMTLDSSPAEVAAKDIAGGVLDLAVGYQYTELKGIVFEPLFNDHLILVTSMPEGMDWRSNYIPIDWDDNFIASQHQLLGEIEHEYRIRASFVDIARSMLLREPASAYVVERVARPYLASGQLRRIEDMPEFERTAHAIYPEHPENEAVQTIALQGLRELAQQYM